MIVSDDIVISPAFVDLNHIFAVFEVTVLYDIIFSGSICTTDLNRIYISLLADRGWGTGLINDDCITSDYDT
jgi:hypothetical protein